MTAIVDLSDIINLQSGGGAGPPENIFFHKSGRVAGAAPTLVSSREHSMWLFDGMPSGGSAPGAAAVPTRTTTGAIPFSAPGGSREKWLISAGLYANIPGVYLLYDRLFHISGLSGTSTADQSVQGSPASPALTRNTNGAGNIVFYEIYGLLGATSTTLTMTYTDQDGNSGATTTVNIGGNGFREAYRAQRIPLAAGDSGVRAVEKVKLTASTGTVGDFGITIARPLAWLAVGSIASAGWRDYTTGLPGIPLIDPNACLSILSGPNGTSGPEIFGILGTVEK